MAIKKERGSNKSNGLCKLSLNEEMTIYTIDSIKQDISKELDFYDRFEMNLSALEEMDSSGIQLLLALRNEVLKKGKTLKITALNAMVSEFLESYGISNYFSGDDIT